MEFDSKEELYFSWMLEELEDAGYITSWNKDKTYTLGVPVINTFNEQLKTKVKEKSQKILEGCEYTPDFKILWHEKANDLFVNTRISHVQILEEKRVIKYRKINKDLFIDSISGCVVEVKGNFDANNMTRLNSINRKWMFDKYMIFVNLVKVPEVFEQHFTPKKYLLTDKNGQQRLLHYTPRTLEQYVEQFKEKV